MPLLMDYSIQSRTMDDELLKESYAVLDNELFERQFKKSVPSINSFSLFVITNYYASSVTLTATHCLKHKLVKTRLNYS